MKAITITRTLNAGADEQVTDTASLHPEGHGLAVVGALPHGCLIEPAGPDDAARLMFYADRHLKLANGLAEALAECLALQSEHDNPDYYRHKNALERYQRMQHRIVNLGK